MDEQQKNEVHGEMSFKKPLEAFDLKFAFHDGHISHVCPQESDPVWSVNIKRGVLSSLQNTMPRFDLSHETVAVIILILEIHHLDINLLPVSVKF